MDATEDFSALVHAVPDHPAVAVLANRRERVDRALETVEGVMLAGHNYFNALSYSFLQTSHVAILNNVSGAAVFAAVSS
jgi:hypothetical protein